ncbi:MAG: lipid-A-disaccharide synthase [Planctomycetaceae bacterium]|jgi:lipid-A-disaccharide synthase|nr:lipid-A-disaccharide synthase [Planctomycetaceae bacterium]
MRIFFSVGEPSGDQHAAELIRELRRRRPEIIPTGFGGPLMQPLIEEAGGDFVYPLTDLAVMGFTRVVPMLGKFYRLVRRAEQIFRTDPPAAVVLVDFPGFNWWIARKARAAGIPVFYFLPPQLWAWASWRIKRIRRFVDHVLCGLPFEKDWYAHRGVAVEYVGHPFFDEVAERVLDEDFLAGCRSGSSAVVAVLPGSRSLEVAMNWPVMQEVILRLQQQHPSVRFLVANYRAADRRHCESQFLAGERVATGEGRVEFHVGRTSEILEAADCCLMVSGSVSLEVLARGTPAVAIYRSTRLMRFLARRLVTCRYMSLPNLFLDDELIPEFPFAGPIAPKIGPITTILDGWLRDPETLATIAGRMAAVYEDVVLLGASERTATAILDRLPARRLARAA